MKLPAALWVLCGAVPAGAAPPARVAVMRFAALTGDVPLKAGTRAALMLANELKSAEGVSVVELKHPSGEPRADPLVAVRALCAGAATHREHHRFRLAEEALAGCLSGFKAAASGLAEVSEVQDAYALLSAVQYVTGRDEDAAQSLATGLALAPSRELPLARASPLFAEVVKEARLAMRARRPGTLVVESLPAGAAVFVDGLPLGKSPLRVTGVPPGLHFWRVQLPTGDTVGGAAEVPSSATAKVRGELNPTDPESKVLAALAQNRLDASVLSAAKEAAAGAEADLLVLGALRTSGKSLALESFSYAPATGALRRLPHAEFDPELLSAGVELFNLAGELARRGPEVGDPVKVPTQVAADQDFSARLSDADYGAAAEALTGAGSGSSPDEPVRTPVDKKRKPLKR